MPRPLADPVSFHTLHLSEIISALSFALDLTEGATAGHAIRSCLLGMRVAERAGLPSSELHELYYALLLKDIGCSSNAARMCQIVGGDDRAVKAGVKLVDWTQPHKPSLDTLKLFWGEVLPGAGPLARVGRIAKIALTQHRHNEEMISLRCDRGASIIRKIGMPAATASCVRSLDEHWNGSGYPDRLRGRDIPVLARIAAIAQHLDVFAGEKGTTEAIRVLQERSGQWFDPELVAIAVALHQEQRLWHHCLPGAPESRRAVMDLEPGSRLVLDDRQIDRICEAFADVVDAKSPFTYRHSIGVADAALLIARTMDLPEERIKVIRRAALLHDVGKLRVPNSILDKPGSLTDAEFSIVREHPALTRRILARVSVFGELAVIAGDHHEKLDGSGYPNHLSGEQLSLESRILEVADIYGALSEDRPYRAGLDLDEIRRIMGRDIPEKLDGGCYEALLQSIPRHLPAAEPVSAAAELLSSQPSRVPEPSRAALA